MKLLNLLEGLTFEKILIHLSKGFISFFICRILQSLAIGHYPIAWWEHIVCYISALGLYLWTLGIGLNLTIHNNFTNGKD